MAPATKTRFSKLLLAGVVLALLTGSACAKEPRVVLHTTRGDVPVTVEVVDTPERRNLGLMFRKDLAAEAGMLFVFETSEAHTFWMKNTPLPLDILFIAKDGKIVAIAENTTPFSLKAIPSRVPAERVLEVNAGYVKRNAIEVGDRVTYSHER